MISKEQALENAINIVYQALFGLSRDEMLATARKHPHFGLGAGLAYNFGDEDEAMRDCLSEQALGVLSEAEVVRVFDSKPRLKCLNILVG